MSPSWGKSEPDHAVATGRGRVCRPTAKAGPDALESCCWATGQRCADGAVGRGLLPGIFARLAGSFAGPLHLAELDLLDQHRFAGFQSPANLSARRRSDSSIFAVVCDGPGPQP